MTPKRTDQDAGLERAGRPDDTAVMAQALRAAADVAQAPSDTRSEKKDEEKISLFWRVFGGTLLSIAALVAVTLYNNVTSNIAELRSELSRTNEARANAVAELKADMVRKEEFATRLSNNWDRIQVLQQQNNTQNATLTSLKTENDGLKERLSKYAADLEGMRKEQSTTADGLKKELAALEGLKEKLATLTVDLKGAREEVQKIRGELDRNQAADNERKERRDTQYKQLDETLKELQRGLADCREKLARFEGQYAPPTPPTPPAPKKTSTPRPATAPPAQPPVAPGPAAESAEKAPMPSVIPPSKEVK